MQVTFRKPVFAGTGNFWQKQQESHGAPLWSLRQTANRIGISGPRLARPALRQRASEHENMPRHTLPLLQLRLEGASVASPRRTAAVATGSALPRLAARQWQGNEASLRSVSLNSPPSRGAPETTIQEKSPSYDTGVQYQRPILGVNSGCEHFCEILTPFLLRRRADST